MLFFPFNVLRIPIFSFFLLYILPVSHLIGPGLTRYRTNSDDTSSWDTAPVSFGDDASAYAYWNCHLIPPNMTLCKSVGYSRMVLPNFLQHESIREVIQQANVWVALVNTDCHADIQRFLCSLYAPVCLKSHQEAKIPPCWELCDQVRNACLPRMRLFGFDWPEIVQCNKFPKLAESMCIPPQEISTVRCAPCEQAITLENIASSYCMADVVLRASLRDVSLSANGASLKLLPSSRTQALKLIRKDGTLSTSFDPKHLDNGNKLRRMRHRLLRARRYRHTDYSGSNMHTETILASEYPVPHMANWLSRSRRSRPTETAAWVGSSSRNSRSGFNKRNVNRRRRARNSHLNDIDGITELQLSCSACSGLSHFNSASNYPGMNPNRWLIMGRRILDAKTNKFANQVQVTFLASWDRDSPEFRKALHAIRTQPISHLCPKKPTVAKDTSDFGTGASPRNFKILRSAPSEKADASKTKLDYNQQSVTHVKNVSGGVRNESVMSSPTNPKVEDIKPIHKFRSTTLIQTTAGTNYSGLADLDTGGYQLPALHPSIPAWQPHRLMNHQQYFSGESSNQHAAYWPARGPRRPEGRSDRWTTAEDLGKVRRGRRGREEKQWRRKHRELRRQQKYTAPKQQQPPQQQQLSWQPPVKQSATLSEQAPLRQYPINPYGNEEPGSYANPFWYP